MEDKVIEIARFMQTTDAEMLANLLRSEGIECSVRDGISSRVFAGRADIGGAKVDLLAKDAARAAEIMHDYGYEVDEKIIELLNEKEEPEDPAVVEQKRKNRARYLTIILLLLAIIIAILFSMNHK